MRLFEGTEFDIPPKCDNCGELEAECKCPPPSPQRVSPSRQSPKVRLEKRKRGKTVSVVGGLDPTGDHLTKLLTQLKNTCGAGGTIRDGTIEIQGDHVQRLKKVLKDLGYRIKT